jgi:hypothetical protein
VSDILVLFFKGSGKFYFRLVYLRVVFWGSGKFHFFVLNLCVSPCLSMPGWLRLFQVLLNNIHETPPIT